MHIFKIKISIFKNAFLFLQGVDTVEAYLPNTVWYDYETVRILLSYLLYRYLQHRLTQ